MNQSEYRTKINRIVLFCYTVTSLLMIGCYAAEVIKGNVAAGYFVQAVLFLVVPLAAATLINELFKREDYRIRYVIAAGMLIFYTFIMATAQTRFAFVYVIPMASLMCIYADSKLVLATSAYTMLVNVVDVVAKCSQGEVSAEDVIAYEIQLGCMITSGLFLYIATRLMKQESDRMFELSEGIEKDALTGAYNRYFFSRNIERLEKYADDRSGLSMAFIDVDNFREFNSEHGHELGDKVLHHMADRIISVLDDYNGTYLIRMGGDEFIILGTEHSCERFSGIIRRIKCKTDQMRISYQGEEVEVRISIGIANEHADHCTDYLELYRLADKRLYRAKETGKNCIICMKNDA